MAATFTLNVVAPDRSVVDETIVSLVAPGADGYFGVMAGHLPLIAALRPGLLEFVTPSGERNLVYVGGGFAEVRPDRVTILADEAARARDIEVSRAEEELEQARRSLRGEASAVTSSDAVADVEKAMQKLKAARNSR